MRAGGLRSEVRACGGETWRGEIGGRGGWLDEDQKMANGEEREISGRAGKARAQGCKSGMAACLTSQPDVAAGSGG